MVITYFDEVKYHPKLQPFQWMAGVTVAPRLVRELEDQVSDLANTCFGSSTLSKETEFHAASIFHRKENFKAWADPNERIEVLKQLIRIVDRHGEIRKVFVRLEPAKLIKVRELDEMTFMFFVERVDMLAKDLDSDCLLIGDHEKDQSASIAAQSLSRFRDSRTPYHFGRQIERLIDTVHFTRSHLSRMLQLADVYAWTIQLCKVSKASSAGRDHLVEFVRTETKLLSPHRFKVWPTDDSWLRKGDA